MQKLPILEEEKSNFILTNFTKEQERLSDLPNFVCFKIRTKMYPQLLSYINNKYNNYMI